MSCSSAVALPDCFRLRWSVAAVDADGAMPLVMMDCCIDYETAGTAMNGGMDRGRALAAMDAELQSAVNALPRNALKMNYSGLANGSAGRGNANERLVERGCLWRDGERRMTG